MARHSPNAETSKMAQPTIQPDAPQHIPNERVLNKDEFGTQRVYKKTSPNSVLTMYLPSREMTLSGNSTSTIRGIVFVDQKALEGYKLFTQLALTFRYGREDEEVMGLRFCNEAIMSVHQLWPKVDEIPFDQLSPLQAALLKRLGDGAYAFNLSLSSQSPPSVQLVPAKRYYGAPIGTSYDVRCLIAERTDEKYHRRAAVKMGVRVIYRTDVLNHYAHGPENFTALVNNPAASPPVTLTCSQAHDTVTSTSSNLSSPNKPDSKESYAKSQEPATTSASGLSLASSGVSDSRSACAKSRKSERGDSFPKLRLSPKSFRLSSRFGRSKSEVEKCPSDSFYSYSKSFQEYDSAACASTTYGGGPQGAVDKPFLLQDGRVGLRASLNKAWYTHGEDVCVTINIRNDSRKTVRKVRICAIQHVDVCMFNNGKFKNVVADSDAISPPPTDRTVPPGGSLNTTVILKPQRGPTKNWIALEDTLQRSTEPEEITGAIAASAVKTPHFLMQTSHSPNFCSSPASCIPPLHLSSSASTNAPTIDEKNVFAIYVSYYVKVKLTLSGMGGELSLKLPFMLVHIDETQRQQTEVRPENIPLENVPANKKSCNKVKPSTTIQSSQECNVSQGLNRIDSVDADKVHINLSPDKGSIECVGGEEEKSISISNISNRRRQLVRGGTVANEFDEAITTQPDENINQLEQVVHVAQVHSQNMQPADEKQCPKRM